MVIERPILLAILVIAAGLVFFFSLKKKTNAGFPSLRNLPESRVIKIAAALKEFVLPGFIIAGAIFLAAGFNFSSKEITRYGYGSDIAVVLDESGSMNEPFVGDKIQVPPSRGPDGEGAPLEPPKERIGKIDAAKKIIRPFIKDRKDRLALVIFGDVVVPIYPLSFNQEGFLRCFDAQTSTFGGTLIDIGLAQALEILRESPAKTKIILLISDGQGRIDDERYQLSAQIKELGIRFYWVAVDHQVNFDAEDSTFMGGLIPRLNPAMARIIPASDDKGLKRAFAEIETLERSLISYKEKVERGKIFIEICWILLGLGAAFYALETIHND